MRAEVDVWRVCDADSDDVDSVQRKQGQFAGGVHDARHFERVETLHSDRTGAAQVEPRRHLGDRRGRHHWWCVQVATASRKIFLFTFVSLVLSKSDE